MLQDITYELRQKDCGVALMGSETQEICFVKQVTVDKTSVCSSYCN